MSAPIIPIKGKSSPAKGATAAARKAKTDWQAVERDYRTGECVTVTHLMTREEMRKQIQGHGWNHYVYGLCHTSGIVFYIGKGTGLRALKHEDEAHDDTIKSQAIRLCDDQLRYTLFACCADDAYAAGIEAFLIRTHKGQLSNIANGSEMAIERMFEPVDHHAQMAYDLWDAIEATIHASNAVEQSARALVQRCPSLAADLFPLEATSNG